MGKPINKIVKTLTLGTVDLGLDPKMPQPAEPEEAPDPDDEEAKRAAQREMQRRRRSGRTSTVLSGSNTLG